MSTITLFYARVEPRRSADTHPLVDHALLVWAGSMADAHRLALRGLEPDQEEGIIVEPRDLLPGVEPAHAEDHVERRPAILRRYEFSGPDDDLCEVCGLASMGDGWPVCQHCGACGDCGHRESCPLGMLVGTGGAPRALERQLVYIAGPYAARTAAERRRNTDRVGLISRMLIQLGAHPVPVHAAIHAGHYGDDDDPDARRDGMRATLALLDAIAEAGGSMLVLEGPSKGTAAEVIRWQQIAERPLIRVAWADLEGVARELGVAEEWSMLSGPGHEDDVRWLTLVPDDGWTEHGSEADAIDTFDDVVQQLTDEAGRDEWHPDAEITVLVEARVRRRLRLDIVAERGDDDEDGERCRERGVDYLADARVEVLP